MLPIKNVIGECILVLHEMQHLKWWIFCTEGRDYVEVVHREAWNRSGIPLPIIWIPLNKKYFPLHSGLAHRRELLNCVKQCKAMKKRVATVTSKGSDI